MVSSGTKVLLICTLTLAVIQQTSCQLSIIAIGIPQILSLLENVNETSTTTSSILPHLENSLQTQEDLQILTNLLLENSTATLEQIAKVLPGILQYQKEQRDEMLTLSQSHQDIHNQTICLLQDHQDTVYTVFTEVANAQTQIVGLLQNQQDYNNQTFSALQENQNTVSHMDTVLTQSANAQTQIVGLLQNQQDYENQTLSTLQENQNTAKKMEQSLSDVAIVQTEMVTLLQSQQQNDLQTKMILQNQQNATDRMETTLIQMAITQADTKATQTQMADALTLIASTQSQMSNQQTQIVSSLNQMANLLQMQSKQLGNISASLTTMVDKLSEQNDILRKPSDCSQVAHISGLYTIYPNADLGSFTVYCDMETDDGGWTVFQRRFDGSVDFFLDWEEYEKGFGNMQGEHWLGLQQVHRLTSTGRWTLRIDMEDFNGHTGYAQYEDFQIGDAASFYQLSIGAYSGTAGYDALAIHNGKPFSTKDSDHDICNHCQSYDGSCALKFQGAWWYSSCHSSNLNGLYQGSTSPEPNELPYSLMCWSSFSGSGYTPIKKSEMKMRRMQ